MANQFYDEDGNPIQPDNLPIGSGTPLAGLMDYDLGNQVNGAVGAPLLTQVPATNELDLSEKVLPLSPDGTNPNFAPEIGAQLPTISGLPDAAPQGPHMINKVVGKNTTATTQEIETADSKKAGADIKAAAKAQQDAIDKESDAAVATAKMEAEFAEKDQAVISRHENAKAALIQKGIAEQQAMNEDYMRKTAEYANYKPETFWGSKSTADKITAAISVGLGSFSQSLLGSGQNVGTLLLERNMQEFDRNQQAMHAAKLKEIDNMKISMDQKRQLILDAERGTDAMKTAARAQVASTYAKGIQLSKVSSVQAALQQKKAMVDMEVAKMQQANAAKYAQHVTKTTEADVIKQMQSDGSTTRDGKPLNVDQNKAVGFYSQMSQSLKNIAKFDEAALVAKGNVGKFMRDADYNAASKDIPVIGKALDAVRIATGDTAEDRLKKVDPDAYNYMQQAQGFVNSILRKESGASIADPEFLRSFRQYFPQKNDGPTEVKEKAERRKAALQDMYKATGM